MELEAFAPQFGESLLDNANCFVLDLGERLAFGGVMLRDGNTVQPVRLTGRDYHRRCGSDRRQREAKAASHSRACQTKAEDRERTCHTRTALDTTPWALPTGAELRSEAEARRQADQDHLAARMSIVRDIRRLADSCDPTKDVVLFVGAGGRGRAQQPRQGQPQS